MTVHATESVMSVKNLRVVSYIEGTSCTEHVPLQGADDQDLTVRGEENLWFYMIGTEYEGKFTIGSGIRVPKEGRWGVMMVYDITNPTHVAAVAVAEKQLRDGTLTR